MLNAYVPLIDQRDDIGSSRHEFKDDPRAEIAEIERRIRNSKKAYSQAAVLMSRDYERLENLRRTLSIGITIPEEETLAENRVGELLNSLSDAKEHIGYIETTCAHLEKALEYQREELRKLLPRLPFDHFAMDIIRPAECSMDGFNFILVVTDVITRFAFLLPIRTTSPTELSSTLVDFFASLGFPNIFSFEGAADFLSHLSRKLEFGHHAQYHFADMPHPQAGSIAHQNVTFTHNLLHDRTQHHPASWPDHLPFIQCAINSLVQRLHVSHPFSLMFARIKHRMSIYTITDLDLISPQDIQTRYNNLHSVIFPPSQVGIETVRHEPEEVGTRRFPDGAYVMVAADSKSGKSSLKWEGPFKIVSWSEYGGTYMLQNHEGIVLPRSFMPYDLKFLSSDGIS